MSGINTVFLYNDRRAIEFVCEDNGFNFQEDAKIIRIEVDYEVCKFPTVKVVFDVSSGSSDGAYSIKRFSLSAYFYALVDVDFKSIKFDNVTVTMIDNTADGELVITGVVTTRFQNITNPQYRYLGDSIDVALRKLFPRIVCDRQTVVSGRYYQLGLNDVDQYCLLLRGAIPGYIPLISESNVIFLGESGIKEANASLSQYKVKTVTGRLTMLEKDIFMSSAINKFNPKDPVDVTTIRYGTKTVTTRYNKEYIYNLLYNSKFYDENGISYLLEYDKIIKENLGDVIKFEVGDSSPKGPIVAMKYVIEEKGEATFMRVLDMSKE